MILDILHVKVLAERNQGWIIDCYIKVVPAELLTAFDTAIVLTTWAPPSPAS
jgi:hypothetical protein